MIAYFTFRQNQPSMTSTPIRLPFPGRAGGPIGSVADVLGVLAVVFGLAGSLTMGTLQVRGGHHPGLRPCGPADAFKLFPYEQLESWTSGWTLTYMIWWLASGPFVGIFVARISRGRTIREFCIGVILVPTLFSMLWFSALGGTAIYIEMFGGGGLSEEVFADVTTALFIFLDYFPYGSFLGAIACFLIFIFLVTSANSGTFVLSMMTSDGDLNPPLLHKLVWGSLIAILTIGKLPSGSITVAKAMAITGALPFSVILLLQIVGFMHGIPTNGRTGPGRQRHAAASNRWCRPRPGARHDPVSGYSCRPSRLRPHRLRPVERHAQGRRQGLQREPHPR